MYGFDYGYSTLLVILHVTMGVKDETLHLTHGTNVLFGIWLTAQTSCYQATVFGLRGYDRSAW